MNTTHKFQPPKDITQWWLAPHCGPGTLDRDDMCGFCGETHLDCALEATKIINDQHLQPGDGDVCDTGCGGSGFWCLGCNRFWAQNSCGENDYEVHKSSDGAELQVKDGYVTCVCGRELMREAVER